MRAAGADAAAQLEVRTIDGVVPVASADVQSIESAKELDAALDALVADVKPNDANGLLRAAEWAIRKGRFDAALDLADRAFLRAANARGAADSRGSLTLSPALLDLPICGLGRTDALDAEGAWRVLSLAASAKEPARAVVARHRMAERARTDDVAPTLLRGLHDGSPRLRGVALAVLADVHPDGTLEAVIERMLFDRDDGVRKRAVETAQAYHDPGVIYPVIRSLQQDNERLRLAAIDAVTALNDARAVGALIANLRDASANALVHNNVSFTTQTSYVGDFDTEIAQAAVIANPVVNVAQHGAVFDVGVAGVYERRFTLGEHERIVDALRQLTGEDHGSDWQGWKTWWDANRQRLVEEAKGAK